MRESEVVLPDLILPVFLVILAVLVFWLGRMAWKGFLDWFYDLRGE